MLHVVDFRTAAGDTGRHANSDAIQPVADGESADQVVLRRPTEHNHVRTDTLRALLRGLVQSRDFEKSLLYSTGLITVPMASDTFTLATDLYVLPMATAGTDGTFPHVVSTKSSLSVGTPSNNEIVFTSVRKAFEGTDVPSDVNLIAVEINDGGAGASLAVSMVAGLIVITIDAAAHTCNDVIGIVNTDPSASLFVLATLGSGSTGTNLCSVFDGSTWGNYTDRFLKGGVPGLAHKITPSGLATFFATAANKMSVGDTIAIEYDQILNLATTGGRLQSTSENANIDVSTALFNTRRYPEKVPNCIPICKRVDPSIIQFANGAVINWLQPATLYFDSVAYLAAASGIVNTAGWSRMDTGTVHNPPTNIQESLDNADGHIDAILDEVEAARTTAFTDVAGGGWADLEARLDAHDGHISGFYSLGPAGSGAMYTNLKTCLTDVITAGGGTIFIKAPVTYDVTGVATDLPEITVPVRIIGMRQNALIINNQRGADSKNVLGFTLRFGAGAENSHIENVQIICGVSGSNWAVYTRANRICFRDCEFGGCVMVKGSYIRFERCHLTEPGNGSGEDNIALLYMADVVDTTVYPTGLGTAAPDGVVLDQCTMDASSGTGIGLTYAYPVVLYYEASQSVGSGTIRDGITIRDMTMICNYGYGGIVITGTHPPPSKIEGLTILAIPVTSAMQVLGLGSSLCTARNVRIILLGGAGNRIEQILVNMAGPSPAYGRGSVIDGLVIETNGMVPNAISPMLAFGGQIEISELHADFVMPDNTNHSGSTRSTTPLIRLSPNNRSTITLRDSWVRLYSVGSPGTIPGIVCGDFNHQNAAGKIVLDNVTFDSSAISGDSSTAVDFYFVTQLPDTAEVRNCTFRVGAHVARACVRYRCNGVKIVGNTFILGNSTPDTTCGTVMFDQTGLAFNVGNNAVITDNKFFHYAGNHIWIKGAASYEPFGIVCNNNTFARTAYGVTRCIVLEGNIGTGVSNPGITIIGNASANCSIMFFIVGTAYSIPVAASVGSYNADGGAAGTLVLPTA